MGPLGLATNAAAPRSYPPQVTLSSLNEAASRYMIRAPIIHQQKAERELPLDYISLLFPAKRTK